MPPRRVFGPGDTALDVDNDTQAAYGNGSQPLLQRASEQVSGIVRKPSIFSRWKGDEESGTSQTPERPAIPSALQAPGEAYSTPLPVLSMIVLSIVRPF